MATAIPTTIIVIIIIIQTSNNGILVLQRGIRCNWISSFPNWILHLSIKGVNTTHGISFLEIRRSSNGETISRTRYIYIFYLIQSRLWMLIDYHDHFFIHILLKACRSSGITLIQIPYWWDNRRESLLATILQRKSDIIPYIPELSSSTQSNEEGEGERDISRTIGKPIPPSPPLPSSQKAHPYGQRNKRKLRI